MSDATDWREKYLTALDLHEAETRSWRQLDEVLRRLVRRLCIAARGMHPRLDDELVRVTTAMRGAANAVELETLLERLTVAVAALDDARTVAETPARPAPAGRTAAAPGTDLAGGATPAGATAAGATAAGAGAAGGAAASPADAARSGAGATVVAGIDGVVEPLLLILDRLGFVGSERVDLAAIRAGLAEPATLAEFEQAVWRLGDLVAAERRRLEEEKHEAERVLKQVTSRLGEFASFLATIDVDHGEADRSGRELDERLRDEVLGIGSSVRGATSLAELQHVVAARLEAIDVHLQAFRTREEARAGIYRERAERMRQRVEQLEHETASLERSLMREQRLALVDGLTGIANRLAYDERIEQEFKRWKRFRQPLTLVVWDLDRFKLVNDSYGHRAGDKVLRNFAKLLREKVRETDFVARYGGEEFVVLLIGTRAADARTVSEGVRESMARLGFHFRGTPVSVTASCGITEVREDDTPARLFDRADKALYRAKEAGRNRSELD